MKRFLLVSACLSFSFAAQAADKKIERLYGSKCGSCHGKDGKAQTEKGKEMKMRDIASADFQKSTDEEMKKVIEDGMKKDKQEMEGFKADIKPAEIDALVKYMREFKR